MIVKPAPGIIGVYALVHVPSGMAYVGSSRRCVGNRLSWHLAALKGGYHGSPMLSDLWSGTSASDWEFRVLEQCPPDVCRVREAHWADRFVFNLGEHPASGYTLSEETRRKQSVSRAVFLETPGAREDLSRRAVIQHQERRFGY